MAELTQEELIALYGRFKDEGDRAGEYWRGHYEHLLFSLAKLIERKGPSTAYYDFLSHSDVAIRSAQPLLQEC